MDTKTEKEIKKAKSEMRKLQKRNAELEKILSKLFEDRALDKISEERYFSMTADFENQLKEVRQKIEECEQTLISSKQSTNLIDKFIKTISNYDDVTELNQYVLLDFVDKIVISQHKSKQDYEDMIDIYFKEIGNIFFKD